MSQNYPLGRRELQIAELVSKKRVAFLDAESGTGFSTGGLPWQMGPINSLPSALVANEGQLGCSFPQEVDHIDIVQKAGPRQIAQSNSDRA